MAEPEKRKRTPRAVQIDNRGSTLEAQLAPVLEFLLRYPKLNTALFISLLFSFLGHGDTNSSTIDLEKLNQVSGQVSTEIVPQTLPVQNQESWQFVHDFSRSVIDVAEPAINVPQFLPNLEVMRQGLVEQDAQITRLLKRVNKISTTGAFLLRNRQASHSSAAGLLRGELTSAQFRLRQQLKIIEKFQYGIITNADWAELYRATEGYLSLGHTEAEIVGLLENQFNSLEAMADILLAQLRAGVDIQNIAMALMAAFAALLATLEILRHRSGGKVTIVTQSVSNTKDSQRRSTTNTALSAARTGRATSRNNNRAIFKNKPDNMSDEDWLEALDKAANSRSSSQ